MKWWQQFAKRLGQDVAYWRERRGMTQAQLGAASGVGQPTISRIERGEWLGSVRTLIKIASALRLRVSVRFISRRQFAAWIRWSR